jgi:hypothetical protein
MRLFFRLVGRKQFFFEKKNQKTLANGPAPAGKAEAK